MKKETKEKKATEQKTKTKVTGESFESLCKELGKRISSVENALLCHRAYLAYLEEHPETGQGKAKKGKARPASLDRGTSFREAAAKIAGVSRSTIDALLQIAKGVLPLPKATKTELAGSSLSNWTRGLRKLATVKSDKDRASIVGTFCSQEKVNPKTAKATFQQAVGMKPLVRTAREAKVFQAPKSHYLANGESEEIKAGKYLILIECKEHTGDRTHLVVSVLWGEKKAFGKFIDSVTNKPTKIDLVAKAKEKAKADKKKPAKKVEDKTVTLFTDDPVKLKRKLDKAASAEETKKIVLTAKKAGKRRKHNVEVVWGDTGFRFSAIQGKGG